MGELAGWGFGYNKDKECGQCGMEKKVAEDSGCCKDEYKHVKLKADQRSPNIIVYQFHVEGSESLQPFIIFFPDLEKPQTYSSTLETDPPRSSDITTYIRNCNFRI
jgi:hypothetical protein